MKHLLATWIGYLGGAQRCPALIAAVIVASTYLALLPTTHAEQVGEAAWCKGLVDTETAKGADADRGRRIQEALRAVYQTDADYPQVAEGQRSNLSDGRIGPVTRSWLARFCADFKLRQIPPADEALSERLFTFSHTLEKHPDEKSLLLGKGLADWIAAEPLDDRTRDLRVRLAGSDSEIATLLVRYQPPAKPAAKPASEEVVEWYQLTRERLDWLVGTRDVVIALNELVKEQPLSRAKFDEKVAAALKTRNAAAPEGCDKALDAVRKHADVVPAIALTETSVQRLRQLPNPPPLSIIALVQRVQAQQTAYSTPDGLKHALLAVEQDAAEKAAENGVDPMERPSPPRIADYLKAILGTAERADTYQLKQKAIDGLLTEMCFRVVPGFFDSALEGLVDIEYPTRELFDAGVNARILGVFLEQVDEPKYDKVLKPQQAVTDVFARLKKYDIGLKTLQDDVECYRAILGEHYEELKHARNARTMRKKLLEFLAPPNKYHLDKVIASLARQEQRLEQAKKIDWTLACRGCVDTNRLPGVGVSLAGVKSTGTVYGLFPAWHAGARQSIDFSMFSRIGYFALPIDDDGNLAPDIPDSETYDFVDRARQFGTRIDWVVRRADWTRWVGSEREKLLNKLRVSIKGWLQKTTGNNLRHLANLATFGYVPDRTRGDGVTLYFEQFPAGEEAERQFKDFFQALNEDLNGGQPDPISNRDAYAVNLLFSREALGKGIYGCEKLSDLTHDALGNDKGDKVRFLVMLAEPTVDAKLELRNYLENCLSGTLRNHLLQTTVPVVPYLRDDLDKAVLKEDISYFHFNFGGLGQWLPVASPTDVPAVVIGANIREAMEPLRNPKGEVKQTDSICPWICPKRWIIFGVMEGLATLLGIAAIAAFASCKVGANMTRLSWLSIVSLVLLVLAIVLFFALLYCDPAWQHIRDGNRPLIGMVILVVAILVWLLMRQKRRASMK